ncbi:Sec-independent protein translocase protein TatB [Litchfieldella rifensis]|uniref:Sec-independent protein translocase protein TatB n=1 Tax=Litchfieldella rifensis TaxID=762643 RepID=A0ABV7LR02_9GAMM
MFDIGFLELLIIGVVGLLVLGPERLPKAARTTGLWIGKIKRSVSGMQREISAQLEAEELRQKLNEQQKKLDESLGKVKRDVERYAEADDSADKVKPEEKTKSEDKAKTEDPPATSDDDSTRRLDPVLEREAQTGDGDDTASDDPAATQPRDKDSRTQ